jgi:hypothetical protein
MSAKAVNKTRRNKGQQPSSPVSDVEGFGGRQGREVRTREVLEDDVPGEYLDEEWRIAQRDYPRDEGLKSGDVKGTITDALPYHFVPNDVRRHRLISISYISLLPCH